MSIPCTVSEIFSVNNGVTFKVVKMAPFNRSCTRVGIHECIGLPIARKTTYYFMTVALGPKSEIGDKCRSWNKSTYSHYMRLITTHWCFSMINEKLFVTVAENSCTILELFDVKWYRDLEIWVEGHQGHWKWHHSKACVQFSCATYSNYGCFLAIFEIFSVKYWHGLDIGVKGHSTKIV